MLSKPDLPAIQLVALREILDKLTECANRDLPRSEHDRVFWEGYAKACKDIERLATNVVVTGRAWPPRSAECSKSPEIETEANDARDVRLG